jgi:DNA-binding protein H-NS
MTTLEAIQNKIAALQAKADAMASKETTRVVAQIRDIMDKHGLTISDIEAQLGRKRRGRPSASGKAASVASKTKGKLPPKYMNPKTGETWSGHARPPQWIAGVKDRSRFLIGEKFTEAAPAGSKPTRVGNYVRGLQPPKYRDPKTGAEWSGRGRAPAWLAVAKDRTVFLIAGATAAKKPVTKKIVTKKFVGKKTPVKKVVVAAAPKFVDAQATA